MDGRPYRDRLIRAMRAGRAVPQDVAEWLMAGFEQFETGDDLAVALGLRTTAQLRASRDHWLRAAAKSMPTAWPATVRANEVRRAVKMLEQLRPSDDQLLLLEAWERHVAYAHNCAALPGPSRLRRLLAIE